MCWVGSISWSVIQSGWFSANGTGSARRVNGGSRCSRPSSSRVSRSKSKASLGCTSAILSVCMCIVGVSM